MDLLQKERQKKVQSIPIDEIFSRIGNPFENIFGETSKTIGSISFRIFKCTYQLSLIKNVYFSTISFIGVDSATFFVHSILDYSDDSE